MAIYLSNETRYDTRGLPEGFDPHKFYEYRYETLVKDSSLLESFIYKYIPFSLIKSFAFAIDPTAGFKVAQGVITPINRLRIRGHVSVLDQRWLTSTRYRDFGVALPNFGGRSNCWSPYKVYGPSKTASRIFLGSQDLLADTSVDTTGRTRLMGSSQGELILWKAFPYSPARRVASGVDTAGILTFGPVEPLCEAIGGAANNLGFDGYDTEERVISPAAVLHFTDYYALRNKLEAHGNALMQKHAISMLKEWSPFKRDYTLFRNAVELRDIPRSVTSLRDTLKNLRSLFVSLGSNPKLRESIFDLKRTGKNIPGEYLSYHFGWKQTWKDVSDLLALPEKLGKKYSFLIRRSGQPTTFRLKRNFSFSELDTPGFDYNPINPIEFSVKWENRSTWDSELRLVINSTFDFPPINEVSFRNRDFLDRIGLIPRPTDLYNLVPWTWLVDWFTGLGNYVELIDQINRDQQIINWGMITCHTTGKLIAEYQSKTRRTQQRSINFVGLPDTFLDVENRHTSVLDFELQLRKDVASILDVKRTSVPSSLTAYQQSILGALLAQRFPKAH
ncbi:TPA_asm: maturation protein [ssRNA phage Esthiorhiza.3_12]|uniref:Maturation protein n=2 Tax=Leviviricetes TaxID=2842243 RepID=A0A8S5L3F9_9VIRU|nr:maturation protein [ssRNA phage Esthiorhiza.3_12]QDH88114.1 MAG: hypothetical protein H3RhizoLitter15189_000004 [Leviviridae sp.]DAD52035.1 TPA_asm: maturation protein [ssRNA phage Esthiorhiza.3_12]